MKKSIICGIISFGLIFQPITLHKIEASALNTKLLLKVGSKNQSVTLLQEKLKELGYFNGKSTGYYGSITKESVKKFQKSNKLVADGIAGKSTLKSLNKAKSKTKPVTRGTRSTSTLNWTWFEKIETILPRGSVFTVLDIYTGKSFSAERTFGTNHADVEPVSKKDTNILKKIYGNEWSWERRPIVVKYNDLSIPASMSGMPHAGIDDAPSTSYVRSRSGDYGAGTNLDAIKDNNMDGHFDIHFLDSKTHTSNKVDKDHQTAIQSAIEYLLK